MRKIELSKDFLIEEYLHKNKSVADIAKILNVHKSTVYDRLHQFNIIKNKPRISKKTLERLYLEEKLSYKKIALIYKISQSQVSNIIKKYGIQPRKSRENQYIHNNYFFKIPNIENCYWAGFIAADGCIARYNNLNCRIIINLNSKDISLLRNFIKNIEYTGKIRQYCVKNKQYVSVAINNANNLQQQLLDNFNIVSHKSLILKPPNITNLEHKLAYIIGYIDGDGYIGISRQKLQLEISGTYRLLDWIGENLLILESGYSKPNITKHGKNCFRLRYDNQRAYKLLTKLYEVPTPYKLARKWDKLKEFNQ